MEMLWYPTFIDEQANPQSSKNGLFTHDFYHHYNAPCGITVQNYFNTPNTKSSYASQLSNLKSNPSQLTTCLESFSQAYKTHNLLWMWGDDFSFVYAQDNWDFMDGIISIITSQPNNRY